VNGTILLIDSDGRRAEELGRPLVGAGYHVVRAASADEGQQAFANEHPALVLIETSLDGQRGVELCQRLKHSAHGRTTPIILHSDAVEGATLAAALEQSGCNIFLELPVSDAQLVEVCERLLPREDAPAASDSLMERLELQQTLDRFESLVSDAASHGEPTAVAEDGMPTNAPTAEAVDEDPANEMQAVESSPLAEPQGAAEARPPWPDGELDVDALADELVDELVAPEAEAAPSPVDGTGADIDAHLDSLFSGKTASSAHVAPAEVAEEPTRHEPGAAEFVGLGSEEVICEATPSGGDWEPAADESSTVVFGSSVSPDARGIETEEPVVEFTFAEPPEVRRAAPAAHDAPRVSHESEPAAAPAETAGPAPKRSRRGRLLLAAAIVVALASAGVAVWLMPAMRVGSGSGEPAVAGAESTTREAAPAPSRATSPGGPGSSPVAALVDPAGEPETPPHTPMASGVPEAEAGAVDVEPQSGEPAPEMTDTPLRAEASTTTPVDDTPATANLAPPSAEGEREPVTGSDNAPAEERAGELLAKAPVPSETPAATRAATPPEFRPPLAVERFEPVYSRDDVTPDTVERVVLRVLVNERGRAVRIQIEQGNPASRLTDAAIDAALRNRYRPAMRGEEVIRAWITENYEFRP